MPLLDPELDPPLLLLLPVPDDELLAFEQTPAWQVPPVAVQSEQAAPPVPHALSSELVWQEPVLSQHPVGQFWTVQALASPPLLLLLLLPLPLPLPLLLLLLDPLPPLALEPPLDEFAEPSSPEANPLDEPLPSGPSWKPWANPLVALPLHAHRQATPANSVLLNPLISSSGRSGEIHPATG